AIRNEPADQRREIDKPGVESINLGADLLHIELAEDQKEQGLEGVVAQHRLGPSRVGEQMLGHIEDQQSPHPIVGAALPHLREKQDVKAFGVTGFCFRHAFLKSGCTPVKGFPVVMTRRLSEPSVSGNTLVASDWRWATLPGVRVIGGLVELQASVNPFS